MREVLAFLTGFAGAAVALLVTFAVAAAMAALGWRRGALAWLASVLGTMGLIVLLKLVFFNLHGYVPFGIHLRSPSGHTAGGVVVYGGLLALLTTRWRAGRAGTVLALAGGLLIGILIGFTRVELHTHSRTEVIVGIAAGLGGILALLRLAGTAPCNLRAPVLAMPAVAAMVLFHGVNFTPETTLLRIAMALRADVRDALVTLHAL